MPGEAPVLAFIDLAAGMLNAHPDRKGLLLHRYPPAIEHRKGVPRAVPNGQHRLAAADLLCSLRRLQNQPPQPPLLDKQIAHPAAETHLASQTLDLPAQPLDGEPEPIGADVGLGLPKNFGAAPGPPPAPAARGRTGSGCP